MESLLLVMTALQGRRRATRERKGGLSEEGR